jgi:hypothetical protein
MAGNAASVHHRTSNKRVSFEQHPNEALDGDVNSYSSDHSNGRRPRQPRDRANKRARKDQPPSDDSDDSGDESDISGDSVSNMPFVPGYCGESKTFVFRYFPSLTSLSKDTAGLKSKARIDRTQKRQLSPTNFIEWAISHGVKHLLKDPSRSVLADLVARYSPQMLSQKPLPYVVFEVGVRDDDIVWRSLTSRHGRSLPGANVSRRGIQFDSTMYCINSNIPDILPNFTPAECKLVNQIATVYGGKIINTRQPGFGGDWFSTTVFAFPTFKAAVAWYCFTFYFKFASQPAFTEFERRLRKRARGSMTASENPSRVTKGGSYIGYHLYALDVGHSKGPKDELTRKQTYGFAFYDTLADTVKSGKNRTSNYTGPLRFVLHDPDNLSGKKLYIDPTCIESAGIRFQYRAARAPCWVRSPRPVHVPVRDSSVMIELVSYSWMDALSSNNLVSNDELVVQEMQRQNVESIQELCVESLDSVAAVPNPQGADGSEQMASRPSSASSDDSTESTDDQKPSAATENDGAEQQPSYPPVGEAVGELPALYSPPRVVPFASLHQERDDGMLDIFLEGDGDGASQSQEAGSNENELSNYTASIAPVLVEAALVADNGVTGESWEIES